MAEVARLQAETILALIQRGYPNPNAVTCLHRSVAKTIATELPPGMLIHSSIGSISLVEWDAMSEANLRQLDTALRKIVETVLIPSITWKTIGIGIQRELAAAGFVFHTAHETLVIDQTVSWKEAADKSFSDLVRIRAARTSVRAAITQDVWVEELLGVAVRLMELRGM